MPRRARRQLRQDPPDGLRRGGRVGDPRPSVRVRAARRERTAQRFGSQRDRRVPIPGRRGLHRCRRRVQLRQRDHRRAPRQRAAGAAHQLGRHRTSAGRVLLPPRERRRRWRRCARRRVVGEAGTHPRRGAERDLAQRRGVLPVLPPGSAPTWHLDRSGRVGEPESGAPRRQPRPPAPGRRRRAGVHGLRDVGGEGPTARGARRARVGPPADHGHRVHVLSDGLRQVRGLGRHRPARPEQRARDALPRALRRGATAKTR